MTLKGYLALMTIATALAVACFLMVAGFIDPFKAGGIGLLIFYASLFVTILGVASILGFVLRFLVFRQRLAVKTVMISFRQAMLTAFVIVSVFWLFSKDLFSWLSLFAIIIGFSALEFFLLSLTHDNNIEN